MTLEDGQQMAAQLVSEGHDVSFFEVSALSGAGVQGVFDYMVQTIQSNVDRSGAHGTGICSGAPPPEIDKQAVRVGVHTQGLGLVLLVVLVVLLLLLLLLLVVLVVLLLLLLLLLVVLVVLLLLLLLLLLLVVLVVVVVVVLLLLLSLLFLFQ